MLDPYYTPKSGDTIEASTTFVSALTKIFAKFYNPVGVLKAKDEYYQMIMRHGYWGDHIKALQQSIVPPEDKHFETPIDKVIWQQDQMLPTSNAWSVTGTTELPHLGPVAVRFAVLAVQSANVERVCKAHGVIHTKSRNRLKNSTVQQLLFCYVNLRLLSNVESTVADFLLDAINNELEDNPNGTEPDEVVDRQDDGVPGEADDDDDDQYLLDSDSD